MVDMTIICPYCGLDYAIYNPTFGVYICLGCGWTGKKPEEEPL